MCIRDREQESFVKMEDSIPESAGPLSNFSPIFSFPIHQALMYNPINNITAESLRTNPEMINTIANLFSVYQAMQSGQQNFAFQGIQEQDNTNEFQIAKAEELVLNNGVPTLENTPTAKMTQNAEDNTISRFIQSSAGAESSGLGHPRSPSSLELANSNVSEVEKINENKRIIELTKKNREKKDEEKPKKMTQDRKKKQKGKPKEKEGATETSQREEKKKFKKYTEIEIEVPEDTPMSYGKARKSERTKKNDALKRRFDNAAKNWKKNFSRPTLWDEFKRLSDEERTKIWPGWKDMRRGRPPVRKNEGPNEKKEEFENLDRLRKCARIEEEEQDVVIQGKDSEKIKKKNKSKADSLPTYGQLYEIMQKLQQKYSNLEEEKKLLREQADKKFNELLNVTHNLSLIHI
eukprot:TRINITY_DN4453_c0_g1_i4.p1 TRINITY_DN4453_c0_g1~~TRINITY_DN4453_c0_g1_i4.p1  ORF type:complete len:431 (+),score=89.91 TRINITY_DN4453_c0_g1_i4:78-1295(+)